MGIDTKGKIGVDHGVKDIQRILKHKFNIDSTIRVTSVKDYYILDFMHKDEVRNLSVFENYIDDETKELGTHMLMGMWGSSIQLTRGIVEGFGGYIKENDCRDEWEYVSPDDKSYLTDEELLEDKLYNKLRESELNFVMKQQIVNYVKSNLNYIKSL